jgi:hypothetical protein
MIGINRDRRRICYLIHRHIEPHYCLLRCDFELGVNLMFWLRHQSPHFPTNQQRLLTLPCFLSSCQLSGAEIHSGFWHQPILGRASAAIENVDRQIRVRGRPFVAMRDLARSKTRPSCDYETAIERAGAIAYTSRRCANIVNIIRVLRYRPSPPVAGRVGLQG